MPCPKCNSIEIVIVGKVKEKPRYKCKKCGKTYIVRTGMYRQKISPFIKYKILELYKTEKLSINKYDYFKKKTYSTREIARILNVSKSFVHKVIKKWE